MDSGLLPLLSCPQLFLFLGLPSPGGSLAPHLDFSQQLPQALQPPARVPSCAPCALPLPVPVGKMWEPWQGQGQGVMAPVEELLAIPSPSPDSVLAGDVRCLRPPPFFSSPLFSLLPFFPPFLPLLPFLPFVFSLSFSPFCFLPFLFSLPLSFSPFPFLFPLLPQSLVGSVELVIKQLQSLVCPGTGKTLLARAVASQLDCNFLKVCHGTALTHIGSVALQPPHPCPLCFPRWCRVP